MGIWYWVLGIVLSPFALCLSPFICVHLRLIIPGRRGCPERMSPGETVDLTAGMLLPGHPAIGFGAHLVDMTSRLFADPDRPIPGVADQAGGEVDRCPIDIALLNLH